MRSGECPFISWSYLEAEPERESAEVSRRFSARIAEQEVDTLPPAAESPPSRSCIPIQRHKM